jgi:hypothetical protein
VGSMFVFKEQKMFNNQPIFFKNTVVAAFEQFQKLRPTSSNSDRQLLEGSGASGEPEMSSPVPPAQNGTLNNVRSCGSLTSISSHTSATSGSSSEEAKKKEQRRHWQRWSKSHSVCEPSITTQAFVRDNKKPKFGRQVQLKTTHDQDTREPMKLIIFIFTKLCTTYHHHHSPENFAKYTDAYLV